MNTEDVKRKYEKQLMRLLNVTGIGIGEKGEDGITVARGRPEDTGRI